jgi:anti-sigma regulatory factor (Ser/Thr protein kinase)
MHEYTSKVRIWELTCPGLFEEVGRARRWTRDILSGTPYADDATLIVSELATNAVQHTASGSEGEAFALTLTRTSDSVTITVTDSGGTRTTPHVQSPDQDTPHGRGLALITLLAHRVEIHGDELGHTVTAELCTTRKQPANFLLAHGYWCECLVNDDLLGRFDATSPEQALRWVRISLMMIATSLDEEPYRQAQQWTRDEQTQALEALRYGKPQDLTLKHRTTEITWTARPVTFLPLAHRQGRTLPACTQQHSTAQLPGFSAAE